MWSSLELWPNVTISFSVKLLINTGEELVPWAPPGSPELRLLSLEIAGNGSSCQLEVINILRTPQTWHCVILRHFIPRHLISFNQCLCWGYFTVICFCIKMEHFGMSLTSDWLLLLIEIVSEFLFSLSLSLPPSLLFPFFPSSLFFGFCFHCAILESPSSFSLCWYSPWDVDGMDVAVDLKFSGHLLSKLWLCRFWTKTHLLSLWRMLTVPISSFSSGMLLRGWLTCLFFLLPTILFSFASDTVVSF